MKIELTKLYLVSILDDDGNEIDCEYVVGDRQEALKVGKEMKEALKESKETV